MPVSAAHAIGLRGRLRLLTVFGAGLLMLSAPVPLRVWVLLVLAPITEELVVRAGLHEGLLRRLRSPLAANALTALVFALAHMLARGDAAAIVVAVPALLIGVVYERSRTVRPCVVLHAAMNAIWLAL